MLGNDGLKIVLVAGLLLLTLVMTVLAAVYPTFPFDGWGLARMQELRTGWMDAAALFLNKTGEPPMAVIPAAVVVLALLAVRRPTAALILTISLFVLLAGDFLKELVNRPRPDHVLFMPPPESLSFPSGHSAYAMVLCGLSIYMTERLVTPYMTGRLVTPVSLKRLLQAAMVVLILATGASRVYLGVHWPSDVVGGYLWGFIILVAVAISWQLGIRMKNALFRGGKPP